MYRLHIFILDEKKYSLVLEYADGGTLRDYLRRDTIIFKWEDQLRFGKEITSAILFLHDDVKIIHGDIVSIFVLFYIINGTISLYYVINVFFFSIPIIS